MPFRLLLRLIFLSVSLALLLSPAEAARSAPAVCSDWSQVNLNGFGMGSGTGYTFLPYNSEEGFEVLTFADQLYLGMEADNIFGLRVWRTLDGVNAPAGQADWQEVAADGYGNPFGVARLKQADHIDSLAEFNGWIYASTAVQTTPPLNGTLVFRSPSGDPGFWAAANSPGFGDVENQNFKDMLVFDGLLCGGTGNTATGAEVWCTADGLNWEQKSNDGFGNPNYATVWSSGTFEGSLYFGVLDTNGTINNAADDIARLFRTASLSGTPAWEQVYAAGAGSYRVDILGELDGHLYIAHRSPGGIAVLRSGSGGSGSWTQVNTSGMDGNPDNLGTVVDGAVVYDSALYLAVFNLSTGFELWATSGVLQGSGPLVDWTQVGGSGLGDPNNLYANLVVFNGRLYAWTSNYVTGQQVLRMNCPVVQNLILMIGDGMGKNQILAAQSYTNTPAVYQSWPEYWISTYAAGGSYDPAQAWAAFGYINTNPTDSAAAATALYAGQKTDNVSIAVDLSDNRLAVISEKARAQGLAVGAVSTVQISHATPGAWIGHNINRSNGLAITDEGLWGDPNTTGPSTDTYHAGGLGATSPPVDVLIGGGHPGWTTLDQYVSLAQLNKLFAEDGTPGAFRFVERITASADGGARLLAVANTAGVTRLAGLFGAAAGNIDYRNANGSGHNAENPTLVEMTQAALAVLSRDPQGFALLIEGGAIDWANHANNMNKMVGEQIGFNDAVQALVNWVDAPTTSATWENTLLIVTGDHESGYLSAGPGVLVNIPLGPVNSPNIAAEKLVGATGRRASWNDANGNNLIDVGETVYWYWNSGSHTNQLLPLYAKGAGAAGFADYVRGVDGVRGAYLDNTDVFKVMDAMLAAPAEPPQTAGVIIVNAACSLADAITAANTAAAAGGCPAGGSGADVITMTLNTTLAGPLPDISSEIILQGQGKTISSSSPITLFNVTAGGYLILNRASLNGGSKARAIANSGRLQVNGVTFSAFTAVNGGAIYNTGLLSVNFSTFNGNTAGSAGGALYNSGEAQLISTTFYNNNSAPNGGAIYNAGSLLLKHSTLSGNSATASGGGLYNSGTAHVFQSTLASNSAATAGGGIANSGVLYLRQSLLSNTSPAGSPDCSGSLISDDYNLLRNPSGCSLSGATAHNLVADPQLDSLRYNNGSLLTRALLPGSPAQDVIPEELCYNLDQRPLARPSDYPLLGDQACDIGAFELRNPETRTLTANGNSQVFGATLTTLTDPAGETAPGVTTVTRYASAPGGLPARVEMPFYISTQAATNSGLNVTLKICYTDWELAQAGLNENYLAIWRYNTASGLWENQGGTLDAAINCVSLTGVSELGNWALAEQSASVNLAPASGLIAGCSVLALDIQINNLLNGYGAGFNFTFDPARLEVLDADPGTTGVQILALNDWMTPQVSANAVDNLNGSGVFTFTQGALPPVSGSGAVARLTLQAKSAGASTLTLNSLALTRSDGSIHPYAVPAGSSQITNTVLLAFPLTLSAPNSSDLRLDLSAIGGASNYNLYRSTTPNFTPTDPPYQALGPGLVYTDTAVRGSTAVNYFYIAQAQCANGFSGAQSPVYGEFDFAITRSAALASQADPGLAQNQPEEALAPEQDI